MTPTPDPVEELRSRNVPELEEDPPRPARAFAEELDDQAYETTVSFLTNAVGFEVFHADGRPRTELADGNVKIETSDEETARARSAAVRVLRELELTGWGAPS